MRKMILTQTTYVPKRLYVMRAADHQLRNNIQEMGRPGYILVARQMGKTNMLFHAKQELEDQENLFPYIDLSNKFDTPTGYFRNIIDIILDTGGPNVQQARSNILAARQSGLNNVPHKEHENELRSILRIIPGKLVIILDEIDALTKYKFSDDVFSQIRSIYFSRINIKEFSRLSYILSGVAEPSELIKNKNLSPFNIGEKILLDDFSKDEFNTFLNLAELPVSEEVAERIWFWTGGHPRMTWDTCAELERLLIDKDKIVSSDVENAVAELYLNRLDMPPIDHIKRLVEFDQEVRDAIIQIHYGKAGEISNSARNKLYLAGIIKSSAAHGRQPIVIKNQVLAHCLSEKELNSIEKSQENILQSATVRALKGEYEDAISLFEEALEENPAENEQLRRPLGFLYFLVERYQEAIQLLKTYVPNRHAMAMLYSEHNLVMSLCYLSTGDLANAKRFFDEALKTAPPNYFLPKLVLGGAAFRLGLVPDASIVLLCESLIDKTLKPDKGISLLNNLVNINQLTALAAVVLCRYAPNKVQNHPDSFEILQQIINSCIGTQKICLLTAASMCEVRTEQRERYLSMIQETFKSESYKLQGGFGASLSPFGEVELTHFLVHMYPQQPDAIHVIIDICVNRQLVVSWSSVVLAYASVLNYFIQYRLTSNPQILRSFWMSLIERLLHERITDDDFKKIKNSLRTVITKIMEPKWYVEEYLRLLEIKSQDLEWGDFSAVYMAAYNMRASGQEQLVPSMMRKTSSFRNRKMLDSMQKIQYATLDYMEMLSLQALSEVELAKRKARTIIAALPMGMTFSFNNMNGPPPSALQAMRETAYQIASNINLHKTHEPTNKKYKPNDRVTIKYLDTGFVVQRKFKHIMHELENAKCIIIDE